MYVQESTKEAKQNASNNYPVKTDIRTLMRMKKIREYPGLDAG
jgi:hypothetical protein